MQSNNVTFSGILKLAPADVSELLVRQESAIREFPELVALAQDKLHVTLLHQSRAKSLKKVQLPQFVGAITYSAAYIVERGEKKSIFVVVNEQDALREYVSSLGVEPEEKRVYHVSIANKTGSPMDSVGHTEDVPIMFSAQLLQL